MARFRFRRSCPPSSDRSAFFDLDDEGRLWLARATLHQLMRDTDEEDIPKPLAQALGLTTSFKMTRESRGDFMGPDRKRLLAGLDTRILKLQKKTRTGRLLRAATDIAGTLGFTQDETLLLAFVAACEVHPEFESLALICDFRGHRDRARLAAAALGIRADDERLLGRKCRLVERGLILLQSGSTDASPFTLARPVVSLFTEDRPNGEAVLERLLSLGPAPRLTLTDFSHVAEVPTLLHLLAGALVTPKLETKTEPVALSHRRRSRTGAGASADAVPVQNGVSPARPLHILLHGPPGTGKSELARALAAALGARLGEVTTEDEDGDSLHDSGRTAALRLLDWLSYAHGGRFCILVDEAEDLLPTRCRGLLGGFLSGSVANKGYYNELLEGTHVPVIWTTNLDR